MMMLLWSGRGRRKSGRGGNRIAEEMMTEHHQAFHIIARSVLTCFHAGQSHDEGASAARVHTEGLAAHMEAHAFKQMDWLDD